MKDSSPYIYVDTPEALKKLTETLRSAPRVAVDTEADSLHHYFEKVCLIQLSFLDKNFILDPLVSFSLADFFEILSQKHLILHAADYDLRMLKKSFSFRPKAPVFDTMMAAQVLGYEKVGLAALVEKLCGVVLSKSAQKSDWSRRPLLPHLLSYASDDTQYLKIIADIQTEHLKKLGRVDWHRECCERVVNVSGQPAKNEDKEAWRIKGSSKLPPEVLVFVRELWKWRDEEARKLDRPPFMILRNEDLIQLAEWRATNQKEPLHHGPAFLQRIFGERLEHLESSLRAAENIPPAQWPAPPAKLPWVEREFPDQKKLEALATMAKTLAAELKIESSFLASRASLTAIVQHQPRSIEKIMEVSGLMHWQAKLLLPSIKIALS